MTMQLIKSKQLEVVKIVQLETTCNLNIGLDPVFRYRVYV
jgi:hypothetical protein